MPAHRYFHITITTHLDPEKHKKFKQSKSDIFCYANVFLALTKEITGKMKKITLIGNNQHKHGLQVCGIFQVCTHYLLFELNHFKWTFNVFKDEGPFVIVKVSELLSYREL